MYENITFETIMQRCLDRVPEDMDKREGSIIYDAIAPAAVELQLMYIELDTILKETFADTASREYLIRRAAERGIIPYEASYAVLRGEFTPTTVEIPIGSRFSCNTLTYKVIEKISDGNYKVQCESAGTVGNGTFGQMIPIEYIQGLATANITELLIPGEDEESDSSIRARYFETFDTKAYGGNITDYITKTNALGGVGATKVTPVWQGGGTVLLTILDSEYKAPTAETVAYVQNQIDPRQDGEGYGIAPIGHIVTVQGATETDINIETTLTFGEGYSFITLKNTIEAIIEEYLSGLRTTWANSSYTVVRISQIDSRLLNITGIEDVQNTKINGTAANLTLDQYEIPVLGSVTDV